MDISVILLVLFQWTIYSVNEAEVVVSPLADGGEGTVNALAYGMNGSNRKMHFAICQNWQRDMSGNMKFNLRNRRTNNE